MHVWTRSITNLASLKQPCLPNFSLFGVTSKAPESERSHLEQVEGEVRLDWKTEPVTVAIVWDDLR